MGNRTDDGRVTVTTKSELQAEESAALFVDYIFVGFLMAISAGLGWKLYGEIGAMVGAVVGFAGSLFFKFGRKVLFNTIMIVLVLAVLLGIVLFAEWVLK